MYRETVCFILSHTGSIFVLSSILSGDITKGKVRQVNCGALQYTVCTSLTSVGDVGMQNVSLVGRDFATEGRGGGWKHTSCP